MKTWPLVLACLLLLPTAVVAAAADEPVLIAPAGCWTMAGGCPARSGAAATEGVRGPLVEAWRIDVGEGGDDIVSEPLVWHDRVFVATYGTRGYHLHVHGLGDGRALVTPRPIRATDSITLGVWGNRVLVSKGEDGLELLRIHSGELHRAWDVSTEDAFYSPVLMGDFVYAIDGESVVCLSAATGKQVWESPGSFRGGLSTTGKTVFVLQTDEPGNIHLVALDAEIGIPISKSFVGTYDAKGAPAEGEVAELAIHPTCVFVQHRKPVRTGGKTRMYATRVNRSGQDLSPKGGIMGYLRLPVIAGDKWLVYERHEPTRSIELLLAFADDKDKNSTRRWDLGDRRGDPELVGGNARPTVAGSMAYAGNRCFEWASRDVTSILPVIPKKLRPVPASGSLLIVPEGRTLVCLREQKAAATGAMFLGAAHAIAADATDAATFSGVVVYADSTSYEGKFDVDAKGVRVTTYVKKGKRENVVTRPMTEVDLLLDAEDNVLYTSSLENMSRIAARFLRMRSAKAYLKYAKAAYHTYDPDLMHELIEEAAQRGISSKRLKHSRKQHGMLIRKPRKIKAKKRERLQSTIAAATKADAERVTHMSEAMLNDPRWPVQRFFAREILKRSPAHAKAAGLVRERVPDFITLPDDFDARAWIDFVDQLRHTKARKIDEPHRGQKGLTILQREYGSAIETWRRDLIALQSDDLLVLTPLAKPGRIAGCLSMGSLVCQALRDVFSVGTNVRKDPWPLVLRLYETQKEYLASTLRPGASAYDRKQAEWTGGHYDPNAGISRIYLPADPDGWKTVMDVYAHEMTHHWIAQRCPLFKDIERKHASGMPGYWIVEGIATFVEEFKWDLESQTWDTRNPSAFSLDVVGNADSKALLPWETVFNAAQLEFHRLKRFDTERAVKLRWRLGGRQPMSESGMFYAQAAAACHYLFHADPDSRKRLLEYVRLYYTAAVPRKRSLEQIIGMTPNRLGERVHAYARDLIRGK